MPGTLKTALDKEIKEESFSCYSVNKIEDMMKEIIEEFLPMQFEQNCTVRYFRKMFIVLGLKRKFLSYSKSFTGMDEKNVCIFFIQNHISELFNNINQLAKIFKKEEEDRINVKHIRQRRKIISYVDKLRRIYFITFYNINNKSIDKSGYYCNERTLRFTRDNTI